METATKAWRRLLGALLAIAVSLGFGALFVWMSLRPPSPLAPVATEFTLHGVILVNPGTTRASNQTLAVAGGVMTVGRARGPVLSGFEGRYVLPGLINMHSHLPPGNPLQLTSHFLLLDLAHGVTSIRDAGDLDGTSLDAERAAARDGYPGPRVFPCGPFVSAGAPKWKNTVVLRGPEDAEPAIARLKAAGMHCVKAYDGLTLPLLEAIRKSAATHGLRVIGHVPETLRYEEALVPDVQHLMGVAAPPAPGHARRLVLAEGWNDVDDARLKAIVSSTREHGLVNTPTLVLGEAVLRLESYAKTKEAPDALLLPRLYRDVVWNPAIGIATYRGLARAEFDQLRVAQAKKLELVRLLHEAGAELFLGTDVQQPFVVPGASLHEEMGLFAKAGIPLEAIWAMATRRSGASLGLPRLGILEDGAPADFLIFREDPTKDLAALDSLEAVVARGRLFTKRSIDAKLAEYRAQQSGFVFDRVSVRLAETALRKSSASPDAH